jgi:hypothetical protein
MRILVIMSDDLTIKTAPTDVLVIGLATPAGRRRRLRSPTGRR